MNNLGLAIQQPKEVVITNGQCHGKLLSDETHVVCDEGNERKRRDLSPKPISPRPPMHPSSRCTPVLDKESSADDSLAGGEVDETLNRRSGAWECGPGFSSECPPGEASALAVSHGSSCSYLSLTPHGTAVLVVNSDNGDSSTVDGGHVVYSLPQSFGEPQQKLNTMSTRTSGLLDQDDGNSLGKMPVMEQLGGSLSTLSKRRCSPAVSYSSSNDQPQAGTHRTTESGQIIPVSRNFTSPKITNTTTRKKSSMSVEDLVNRYKNLSHVHEHVKHGEIAQSKTCTKRTPKEECVMEGPRRSLRSHQSLRNAMRPAIASTSCRSGDDSSVAGTVHSARHHRSLSERRHRSSHSRSKRSGRRIASNKSNNEALLSALPPNPHDDEYQLRPRRRRHDLEGRVDNTLDSSTKTAASDSPYGEETHAACAENTSRRSSRARRSLWHVMEQPISGEDTSVAGTAHSTRHHRSLSERRHRSSLSSFRRSRRRSCANKSDDDSVLPSRPTSPKIGEKQSQPRCRDHELDRQIEKALGRAAQATIASDPSCGKETDMLLSPNSSRRHRHSTLPTCNAQSPASTILGVSKDNSRRGSRSHDIHVGKTLALASPSSATSPEGRDHSSRRHRSLSGRRRQHRREQEGQKKIDDSQRSIGSRSRRAIRASHSSTQIRPGMMSPRQYATPHQTESEALMEANGSAPSLSPSRSRLSASSTGMVSPTCVMMDVSFHSHMHQVDDIVATKLKGKKIALQAEKVAAASASRTPVDKNLLRRIGAFFLHPT